MDADLMIVKLLSVGSGVLLLGATVVLLTIALRSDDLQRRASFRMILFIYMLGAAVPLTLCAVWWRDAMRVVIELHGVAFRSEGGATLRKDVRERTPGSSRVLIGDVPMRRRGIPQTLFGTLVFNPRAAGEKGSLVIELPAPDRRAGVIATSGDGILGAQNVDDGDRICIAGECWTHHSANDSFTANGRTFRIPPRQAKIPGLDWIIELPFATPVKAGARTYSVDFLARHGAAQAQAESLRSFIAYADPGPRLRLVVLDSNVTLRKATGVAVPLTQFRVEDGARIRFYTLPPAKEGFEADGIVERRSAVYRAGTRSFALDLDTPEVHALDERQFKALQVQREGEKGSAVALAMGDAQIVDRSLYFSGLSESVALQSTALIELPPFFPFLGSDFRIVSPRGPADASLGSISWIGASDLAAIRMQVIRPPLMLLLAALVLQWLKVFSASQARFTLAQALFAGAIELLAGVRLLFGHRVWVMPPHRLEAAELGLLAWMALPWMFLVASISVGSLQPLRRGGIRAVPREWLLPLGGLLFSIIFCARLVEGPKKVVWILCHLLAVGVALLRAREVRQWLAGRRESLRTRTHAMVERAGARSSVTVTRRWFTGGTLIARLVAGALAAVVAWLLVRGAAGPIATLVIVGIAFMAGFAAGAIARKLRVLVDVGLTPFLIWALVFALFRIVLLLFGFKESVMLPGGRISLSAIYVPAAAILEGLFLWRLWQRTARDGRLHAPDLSAALWIIAFVWVIPAALTSDIGLALVNVPVFLLLLFAIDRRNVGTRAMIIVAILLIVFAPVARLFLPLIASEETLLSLASNTNVARFFHFAAPDQLQQLATKRGENLAVTSAILQRYISTGLFGRGYGHSEVSPHLGDTALRDFAPAVFVAAEWGLAGTLAMLVLYSLFGVIAWRLTPWSSRRRGMPFAPQRGVGASVIACVAAGTIALVSIYMILANHELLLLTGKNAYLLGLDSAGDVIETMGLLLIVAYGAAMARDAAAVGALS